MDTTTDSLMFLPNLHASGKLHPDSARLCRQSSTVLHLENAPPPPSSSRTKPRRWPKPAQAGRGDHDRPGPPQRPLSGARVPGVSALPRQRAGLSSLASLELLDPPAPSGRGAPCRLVRCLRPHAPRAGAGALGQGAGPGSARGVRARRRGGGAARAPPGGPSGPPPAAPA